MPRWKYSENEASPPDEEILRFAQDDCVRAHGDKLCARDNRVDIGATQVHQDRESGEGAVRLPSPLSLFPLRDQARLFPALRPDLIEAATAVDRSIVPRHERHSRLSPALRANHRVHFTRIAPCSLAPPGRAASRTALWLVHEPLLCKELLLTDREHELLPAVAATQGFVRKAHFSLTPFTCREVWSQFSLC